jgi:hypothetical protein
MKRVARTQPVVNCFRFGGEELKNNPTTQNTYFAEAGRTTRLQVRSNMGGSVAEP